MAALRRCPHCEGFLPPRGASCPHCGERVAAGPRRGLARSIFGMAGGGAIAITLMACYGAPYNRPVAPPEPQRCPVTATDQDGDCSETPADCNDADPAIHPGAQDLLGDQIDQNCDGVDGSKPAE